MSIVKNYMVAVRVVLFGAVAGLVGLGSILSDAHALDDGDTVRLIVPFSPGGGFDTQARLVAPYLERALRKHDLPNVNVIVENITGGAGVSGTAMGYVADADGETLLLLDINSALWQQTLSSAPFDVTKFTYIGQLGLTPSAFFIRADLRVTTFAEAVEWSHQDPILIGTSGHGSLDHLGPMVLSKMLEEQGVNLELDYVHFAGTGDILASIRRGEAEGTIESQDLFYQLVEDGTAEMLFTVKEGSAQIPASEVLDLPADKLEMFTNAVTYRRILVAPPGLDPAVRQIFEAALEEALSDPELQNRAAEARAPLTYLDGDAVRDIVDRLQALSDHYGEFVRDSL